MKKTLIDNHDVGIILTDIKWSFHFNIKDDWDKQYKHDLVYFSKCPSTTCADSYIVAWRYTGASKWTCSETRS